MYKQFIPAYPRFRRYQSRFGPPHHVQQFQPTYIEGLLTDCCSEQQRIPISVRE